MEYLVAVLAYAAGYFYIEVRQERALRKELESFALKASNAMGSMADSLEQYNEAMRNAASGMVKLGRRHTIVCDEAGVEVSDEIRDLCSRDWDKYLTSGGE